MYIALFLFTIGFGCHKKPIPQTTAKTYVSKHEAKEFLYFAILTGLERDNISQETLQKLLQHKHLVFVAKCPICTTVQRSFSAYKGPKTGEKDKLPPEVINGLNGNIEQQKEALQKWMALYTQQHLKQLNI